MLQDLTAHTSYGACDLVPFLRRDAGQKARVFDWERPAAAVALHRRGWEVGRIAKATGWDQERVREVLDGVHRPVLEVRASQRHTVGVDIDEVTLRRLERAREKSQRTRARRLAERVMDQGRLVHPRAPHGQPHTYKNWGCHCHPCTAAYSVERRRARQQQRGRS